MRARYAFVVLALLTLAMTGVAILFSVSYYHREAAAQQRQASQQAAAQRAQGALLEQKLCTSLEPLSGLARLRPPAGDAASNPSRAYEQELSAKLAPLAQLAPDLGCKERP